MQTAKDLWFLDTIKKTGIPPEELAIIIDEVHHAGSKTGRGVLEIDAKYRIGLSATWKRPNPTENKRTLEYFKGNNNSVVHSYSLKDGIKDGLLSPYEYHIHPRYLSGELQDEFRENLKKYNNEVKKISVRLSFSDDDMLEKTSQGSSSELFKLKNAWKNTVNKAFARISEIMKIVETEQKNLKKCVIYCASKDQSDRITRELRGHKGLRDTFPYDSRTESDVRIKARKRFEDTYRGEPRFIVGIHCLDEGIDMPALDSGIFANSSKTKREWIQRRGRILRKHKDKEVSIIHDIIILPDKRAKLTEGEREYIDDEIERLSNFAEDAINSKDTIQEIRSLRRI